MSTTTESPVAAPDEVVTHAPVRDVVLPGGAGVLALITLDNGRDHTSRIVAMSFCEPRSW